LRGISGISARSFVILIIPGAGSLGAGTTLPPNERNDK
jgi:hypothetical protein